MNNRLSKLVSMFNANLNCLSCPICRSQMTCQENALICQQKHTFNLSKQGYCDFASGASASAYEKDLWEARCAVTQHGFFNPLLVSISKLILKHKPCFSIDAGCGEGSLTACIARETGCDFLGIDLSRDGIRLAGRSFPEVIWAVADLARLPVTDNAAGFVVNCLSPARYSEFHRVLHSKGLLVKVVPTERHLHELRNFWGLSEPQGQATPIPECLFNELQTIPVEQTIQRCEYIQNIAAMTPMGWRHRDKIPQAGALDATLSVQVKIFMKK